jgi:hypothetical protein
MNDRNNKFIIYGKVQKSGSDDGISGLVVEVWDKDIPTEDDFLGSGNTDENGRFKITFIFKQHGLPDIYLNIKTPDGRKIYSTIDKVRNQAGKQEKFIIELSEDILKKIEKEKKEENNMEGKNVESVKEIIKKFDPELVIRAIQERDIKAADVEKVKMEIKKAYDSLGDKSQDQKIKVFNKASAEIELDLINKEIERTKDAIKDIDKEVLLEAVKDFLDIGEIDICFYPVCICPEGGCLRKLCPFPLGGCGIRLCPFPLGGCLRKLCPFPLGGCGIKICAFPIGGCGIRIDCGYRIDYPDKVEFDLEYIGESHLIAIRELEKNDRINAVISDGVKIGYLGKCLDSVTCSGRTIFVMSKCTSSLVTLDINEFSDPMETILKVAEKNPELKKRINKMMEKIKGNKEL